MSETTVPFNARIQIEVGLIEGQPDRGRLVIDGRDVSIQVRAVEFVAKAGEPTDVRVTYASPQVTVEGFADVSEVTDNG